MATFLHIIFYAKVILAGTLLPAHTAFKPNQPKPYTDILFLYLWRCVLFGLKRNRFLIRFNDANIKCELRVSFRNVCAYTIKYTIRVGPCGVAAAKRGELRIELNRATWSRGP